MNDVAEMHRPSADALMSMTDQAVDMFTERGFALANRIAKAYSTSDAVPAQFRAMVTKKVGREEHVVENPAAIGNCLVAIEVARAVGMSITAVMQNADMIEGKLRWSGRFVIGAINASQRFTPLRFQTINRGKMKASYKEKTGWDNQINRPVFTERAVEVDDIECIAWALPKGIQEPRVTLEQLRQYPGRMLDLYKALGLPVVESAPVTMKMVVEEGWFAKSGSKWQTDMRQLMFQYRTGSFFGNVHAPDVVMGMGPTVEEIRDTMTFDMASDGTVDVGAKPSGNAAPQAPVDSPAKVVRDAAAQRRAQRTPKPPDPVTGEVEPPAQQPVQQPAQPPRDQQSLIDESEFNRLANAVRTAVDADAAGLEVDAARSLGWPDADYEHLCEVYRDHWSMKDR